MAIAEMGTFNDELVNIMWSYATRERASLHSTFQNDMHIVNQSVVIVPDRLQPKRTVNKRLPAAAAAAATRRDPERAGRGGHD